MKKLRLEIEYLGTRYSGWQYQPGLKTVQGTIDEAIRKIVGEPVRVIGAARTDTGVHALGQVAHFQTATRLAPDVLRAGINSLLPPDIGLRNIAEVSPDFHARFDAKLKRYRYRIILGRSPLRGLFAWELPGLLSISAIDRAKDFFVGGRDYSIFCPVRTQNPWVAVRRIVLASSVDELAIDIEADRFLYKLARRIVGALVDSGRGALSESDLAAAFRRPAPVPFVTAPARGLTLVAVTY